MEQNELHQMLVAVVFDLKCTAKTESYSKKIVSRKMVLFSVIIEKYS